MPAAQICVARIGAPHGIRGAVKLWTFTEDPLAVMSYGQLKTEVGTDLSRFFCTSLGSLQKMLVKSRFTMRKRTRAPFDRSSGTARSTRHIL